MFQFDHEEAQWYFKPMHKAWRKATDRALRGLFLWTNRISVFEPLDVGAREPRKFLAIDAELPESKLIVPYN